MELNKSSKWQLAVVFRSPRVTHEMVRRTEGVRSIVVAISLQLFKKTVHDGNRAFVRRQPPPLSLGHLGVDEAWGYTTGDNIGVLPGEHRRVAAQQGLRQTVPVVRVGIPPER